MKNIVKISLLYLALFSGYKSVAALHTAADSATDIFVVEKQRIIKQIDVEKLRISGDYPIADSRLFNLVDSISNFIDAQNVHPQKKDLYFVRLLLFLKNINRDYTDSYLKSGNYIAVLSFYPEMIRWDEDGTLLANLKKYTLFSIKALRLVPDETAAKDFLWYFLADNPDEIFRYAEEFDDRDFALSILEKATRLAPESAKRYYSTGNAVSTLLWRSRDPYVKKSFEIYYRYGIKSRAYLLLDHIVNNKMPVETADSIGCYPDKLFSTILQLSAKYQGQFAYSYSHFVEDYSIRTMRKLNSSAISDSLMCGEMHSYTADEMFTMLSYGCREIAPEKFRRLMNVMLEKAGTNHVSANLVSSTYKEQLKYLISYCSKNFVLDKFLSVTSDAKRNDILALAPPTEPESTTPPFKIFASDESAPETKKHKAELNKIPHARPPVETAHDVVATTCLEPACVSSLKSASAALSNTYAKMTDIASKPFPEPIVPVKITLDEKTKALVTLKKNIFHSLQNVPAFINKDYAEEVLSYAAQKEPDELLKKIQTYKEKPFCKKILEQCALTAPLSVKKYLFDPAQPVNYILKYSQNPVVKKIIEIAPRVGTNTRSLLLLNDIASGKMSLKEAINISNEPNKLFNSLVGIISHPQYVGKYSIDREMRDYSLRFVREINNEIAANSAKPFASVENFSSAELYFLMLYGRDEVFASTFSGLFNRFMQKLPNNDGNAFLRSINYNQFRDFLSLCAGYGTLGPFLAGFPSDTKSKLLTSYISNLENKKDDLSSIVLIAEAISNLNDSLLLSILQSNIKKEYERVKATNNEIGLTIYGVLSSMISGNAIVDAGWYKRVSQQFKISPVNSLPMTSLFGKDMNCVEQMYFYDDEDGKTSFNSFINTYKGSPAWGMEMHDNYVRIYSRKGMNVEILANKPEDEENGLKSISHYLREKKSSPAIIVHRGHSFHTETTLEKVPSSAKLVFLGSCGGFYQISMALENAPDAHVIATKQVGTKTINDAMLFALNEDVRNGEDIEWNDFWEKMRVKLGNNQYFSDYVPPHKNLEAIFIKAYYKTLGV